jgi:hypothetical protein
LAKASNQNFLGSNVGDPTNNQGTSGLLGDTGGGFLSEIFQIFQNIANSLGNAISPGGGITAAIVSFLILLGLI